MIEMVVKSRNRLRPWNSGTRVTPDLKSLVWLVKNFARAWLSVLPNNPIDSSTSGSNSQNSGLPSRMTTVSCASPYSAGAYLARASGDSVDNSASAVALIPARSSSDAVSRSTPRIFAMVSMYLSTTSSADATNLPNPEADIDFGLSLLIRLDAMTFA